MAIAAIISLVACGPEDRDDLTITKADSLVVGIVNDAPGFSFGTTNPAGFDADLMRAIGKALKMPVTPMILVQGDREQALKDKRVTIIIAAYSITKERNEQGIDFAGPYMVSSQALLVPANSTIKTRQDLQGKNICTVAGTTGVATLFDAGGNQGVQGVQGVQRETHQECVDLVKNNRADGYFTDTLILYGYVQNNAAGTFKVVLAREYGQNQFYGVGLLGGHHADCLKLNEVINEFLQDKWRGHFQTALPAAVEASPANDPNIGDFESAFKPRVGDMPKLSCRL